MKSAVAVGLGGLHQIGGEILHVGDYLNRGKGRQVSLDRRGFRDFIILAHTVKE
jgi:hypothetical protein